METASLKSFATWARTALIREVTARIAAVLAPASPERVEQSNVVAALEKAVHAAGGGGKGRSAVADRVAYTWFNRIIALRFMDANGYTGIGVVSPQAGVEVGQPEILAEAKRANIDSEVVSRKVRETVSGLLNGTRRSDDSQGEAYALLLAEYCRHWNRSMPFMFQREGDFTESLIPANLLADDSVLNRAVNVLTTEVCQDVEAIGWLYQFYISERKDEVFAGFKKKKKAGADEIPAATQLFTPHWIVRYLVENSLGRLWMLNRPTSRLVDQMEYFIAPCAEDTEFLKINAPEQLKVIDPACGSGHMLTYAFDLLYAIYEEEGYAPSDIPRLILANNLYGVEIDPRAGALAAFSLTMKARRCQRTFFKKKVEANICVLEPMHFSESELQILLTPSGHLAEEGTFWNQFSRADIFGSLLQPDRDLLTRLASHIADRGEGDLFAEDVIARGQQVVAQAATLTAQYAVVVANPPYMGSKNMAPMMVEFARSEYPSSKPDLYSMFIERNLSFCARGGAVGMITMHSWMFLSTFGPLRNRVLREYGVATLAHLGSGAFDTIGGEVVSTTAFVLRGQPSRVAGVYLGLSELDGEGPQSKAARAIAAGNDKALRYEVASADFNELPLASMAYWLSPDERHIYRDHPRLETSAKTRQGLSTADNDRFLRYWWEVSIGRTCRDARSREEASVSRARWFPLQKGGSPRRWVGNDEFVVDWAEDGRALLDLRPKSVIRNPSYYFREGATWSNLSGTFAVRYSPAGFIFDSKGPMLFPHSGADLHWILGYLNTPIARKLIDSLSPTLDYHEGPVGRIPVVMPSEAGLVGSYVKEAVQLAISIWSSNETSPAFQNHSASSLPRRVCDALGDAREQLLSADQRILEIERDIEGHFRDSGAIDSAVFPVETLSPTGLVNSSVRDPAQWSRQMVEELVSYAVGCMFGRYSLDAPGLILADQGGSLQDYFSKISMPTFTPDADNVVPIVAGDWFEDDIVARFRQFLRTAFGEQHLEENMRFVTDSLEVRELRDYFVKSFYRDHVQRYKKRPIYWLFSSPKGSFNALIYMHRYTSSTVSTVLNEYLREYKAKLSSSLQHHERLAAGSGTPREQAAAHKEVDRLRKVLMELDEYEHDALYPLASQQIEIDLDDGVKVNYLKFGAALKKIPGLEVAG
ncbi:BREX-1 system adenine-specific DNA-methyltransferase PglX [Actinomycetes bacterium M1A6_2h]